MKKFTLAHVTHEAVEQLGGIGTVLEGLMTSPVYQQAVQRSILIGPTATQMQVDPSTRLGDHGEVLYSSIDGIDEVGLSGRFRPIEWAFDVAMVYGKRHYETPGDHRTGEAEVLLIDVFRINHNRLNVFKHRLWETFGLDSGRYENSWDYEEYVRIAEPAFYALQGLLSEEDRPCVLFAHEFMGIPAALQAIMDGGEDFRTVFHAHECSTARHVVEHYPGHDTMFYNVLDKARELGLYMDDVFGDQSGFFRHALVSRTHLLDGIIAVGDRTRDELRFLSSNFDKTPINLVYNGVPAGEVKLDEKLASRKMLADYSEKLTGRRPELLMTHVTRPVISKGMWRDVKVCHELDRRLGEAGQTGVLYILTTGGGVRRQRDVVRMEKEYGWPNDHREGYPDLVGPEVDLFRMIKPFNESHENLRIILVNQFGWSRSRIGARLPEKMDIGDLRRAADVEFGMATYEPFGISPLEPLNSGAICVISNICGCDGFVRHVADGKEVDNVLSADFTQLDRPMSLSEMQAIDAEARDAIEDTVAAQVAEVLWSRLPRNDKERQRLLETGGELAKSMGWDRVIDEGLLPMLNHVRQAGVIVDAASD